MSSAARTVPMLASTMALVGVVIVAWACAGVQLYQGAYDVEDANTARNFDNGFDAATAMTVLITVENFPDVMRPALDDPRVPCSSPRSSSPSSPSPRLGMSPG